MRFQTKLADLLESREWANVTSLSWTKLSSQTGISVPTLQSWYNARIGSDRFLSRIEAETAGRLMQFLELGDIAQLIEVVAEDKTPETEKVSPQRYQETAIAAILAA